MLVSTGLLCQLCLDEYVSIRSRFGPSNGTWEEKKSFENSKGEKFLEEKKIKKPERMAEEMKKAQETEEQGERCAWRPRIDTGATAYRGRTGNDGQKRGRATKIELGSEEEQRRCSESRSCTP